MVEVRSVRRVCSVPLKLYYTLAWFCMVLHVFEGRFGCRRVGLMGRLESGKSVEPVEPVDLW